MCLALPARIVAVEPEAETATVSLGGIRKTISVALIDAPEPGEFVLVHVGHALARVSPQEAEATLAAMRAAGLPLTEEAPA